MLLLVYWVGCVLIAIAVMAGQISSKQKATTSLRKYFHILAVVVFIPGILVNPCLMYLASGLVLALFLLLEVSIPDAVRIALIGTLEQCSHG